MFHLLTFLFMKGIIGDSISKHVTDGHIIHHFFATQIPHYHLVEATRVLYTVLKEKNMYGKKVWGIVRTTYLIGPDQTLLHVFPKVKPEGHAEEVLALLEAWKKAQK